jgi:hypothetical protein
MADRRAASNFERRAAGSQEAERLARAERKPMPLHPVPKAAERATKEAAKLREAVQNGRPGVARQRKQLRWRSSSRKRRPGEVRARDRGGTLRGWKGRCGTWQTAPKPKEGWW